MPPIAASLSLMSSGAEYLPLTLSVGGLGVMGYLAIKNRAFLSKAVVFIVRKLTRSRR